MEKKYKSYANALIFQNLDSLESRRKEMCLKFAKNGIKNDTLNDLFKVSDKMHQMKTREDNTYKVDVSNTNRLTQVLYRCETC